jgi:non-canonical (house-cleaning) NTP pyrophosphatase
MTRTDGDYFIGLEGGVAERDNELRSFAWIAIEDREGNFGQARTAELILPEKIKELIQNGMELGDADDLIFGKNNSKQENGAVGILTGDVINRYSFYKQAVILALIPFKNPVLYENFKVKN